MIKHFLRTLLSTVDNLSVSLIRWVVSSDGMYLVSFDVFVFKLNEKKLKRVIDKFVHFIGFLKYHKSCGTFYIVGGKVYRFPCNDIHLQPVYCSS